MSIHINVPVVPVSLARGDTQERPSDSFPGGASTDWESGSGRSQMGGVGEKLESSWGGGGGPTVCQAVTSSARGDRDDLGPTLCGWTLGSSELAAVLSPPWLPDEEPEAAADPGPREEWPMCGRRTSGSQQLPNLAAGRARARPPLPFTPSPQGQSSAGS